MSALKHAAVIAAARLVALLAAFGALAGCADVRRRATVSVEEYAAYRRFRVAPTLERKLARGYDYLAQNPGGAFRPEVAAWFFPSARAYVARHPDDRDALETFLGSVPSGPLADRAAERLVQLDILSRYRARQERAFDEHVARLEGRLEAADAGRRELVSGVSRWVRRIASIRSWGGRTSELDSDFIYAYRLTEPAARCDDESCEKTITVAYAVPEGKSQSDREAVYDVGLRLEKGGVGAAWLTGPELFTRLAEAVRVRSVSSSGPLERAEAIGQATQVLALALEPMLPTSRCAADAVSPVVLRRTCDGVDVRVISAIELSEEDRVVVEPVKRAP